MKTSKFCCGRDFSDTVQCLTIQGMLMAVLGLVGGAIHIALTILKELEFCNEFNDVLMKGTAFSHLLIHPGLFLYSYMLYKKNTNGDVEAVKEMIKIGCYFSGYVQAAFFATVLLAGIILLICYLFLFYGSFHLAITLTLFGGILIIFPFLLLHGIKQRSPKKIKTWIIFQFVILVLCLISVCTSYFLLDPCLLWTILQLIGRVSIVVYTSGGLVIVQYYIVLEDQHVLESPFQISSNDDPCNDGMHSKETDLPPTYSQMDLPPPYSHVV